MCEIHSLVHSFTHSSSQWARARSFDAVFEFVKYAAPKWANNKLFMVECTKNNRLWKSAIVCVRVCVGESLIINKSPINWCRLNVKNAKISIWYRIVGAVSMPFVCTSCQWNRSTGRKRWRLHKLQRKIMTKSSRVSLTIVRFVCFDERFIVE